MTDEKFLNSSGMICYDLWAQTRTQSTFEIVYYFFFCCCLSGCIKQAVKATTLKGCFGVNGDCGTKQDTQTERKKNRTRLKILKKQHPDNKREERTNR